MTDVTLPRGEQEGTPANEELTALDGDGPPAEVADGWQTLPFTVPCQDYGQPCNTSDPPDRIRHRTCPPPADTDPGDGLPAGWSWFDTHADTTAPCDLCGQPCNTSDQSSWPTRCPAGRSGSPQNPR